LAFPHCLRHRSMRQRNHLTSMTHHVSLPNVSIEYFIFSICHIHIGLIHRRSDSPSDNHYYARLSKHFYHSDDSPVFPYSFSRATPRMAVGITHDYRSLSLHSYTRMLREHFRRCSVTGESVFSLLSGARSFLVSVPAVTTRRDACLCRSQHFYRRRV